MEKSTAAVATAEGGDWNDDMRVDWIGVDGLREDMIINVSMTRFVA